jgi:hypothetical protein
MKTTDSKVKLLTTYSIFMTVIMVSLSLFSFKMYNKIENFDEINVKRINIIENDGTIRMVLSNKERQHPGRIDGKDFDKRERRAGLVFFNDEGDECGGIGYSTEKRGNGVFSGMLITMDRYKNDEVVNISNAEMVENGKIVSRRGIGISDFPADSHLGKSMKALEEIQKITDPAEREKKMKEGIEKYGSKSLVFLGKNPDNTQGLFLNDAKGQPRMKIYVDEKGNPKIQTLDSKGKVKDFIVQ